MTESGYPNYIQQMLDQAQRTLADEATEYKATLKICIEILALYPDHPGAAALILETFSDPRLIYENRQALCVAIEEWDDRPQQFRARLAKSFNMMCCWSRHKQESTQPEWQETAVPQDVASIINEADFLMSQNWAEEAFSGQEAAWHLYRQAFARTNEPARVFLYVAHQYACLGYFAEAAELLHELLAVHGDFDDALRLWVEVCWWRDNRYQIPWIPPYFPGNGRRWERITARLNMPKVDSQDKDKTTPLDEATLENLPKVYRIATPLNSEIIAQINQLPTDFEIQPSELVDWHYLEKLEKDTLQISDFPEWAQYLIQDIEDPAEEIQFINYLLRLLSNPINNSNRTDLDNL